MIRMMLIRGDADAGGDGLGTLAFGDFQLGLVLAYFGGVDLLVDPFSNAGTAQIALHINRFYDCDVRQASAIAYTKDFKAQA